MNNQNSITLTRENETILMVGDIPAHETGPEDRENTLDGRSLILGLDHGAVGKFSENLSEFPATSDRQKDTQSLENGLQPIGGYPNPQPGVVWSIAELKEIYLSGLSATYSSIIRTARVGIRRHRVL